MSSPLWKSRHSSENSDVSKVTQLVLAEPGFQPRCAWSPRLCLSYLSGTVSPEPEHLLFSWGLLPKTPDSPSEKRQDPHPFSTCPPATIDLMIPAADLRGGQSHIALLASGTEAGIPCPEAPLLPSGLASRMSGTPLSTSVLALRLEPMSLHPRLPHRP